MSDMVVSKWPVTPLGQIAEVRRGITYNSAMLESKQDGLPYINMKSFLKGGGFNSEGTKHYVGRFTQQDLVGVHDLLIANTDVTAGDIIGVPALLPEGMHAEKVLYSHHVTRLRINGEVIVPFLYYLLCLPEYRSQMLRIARGTTVLMLDMPAIKRIPIRMPEDKSEQCRISKILLTLDKAIEKTEALIAKYQQIKAGLMHDLFTRGIASDGKLRPPREQAPELYKETPIGWIPKEWDAVKIDNTEIVIIDGDRGVHYPQAHELLESGHCLFLSATNVTKNGFKFDVTQFISREKDGLLGTGKLERGDIVITTRGTVGNIAYFDDSVAFSDVRINSGMVIIRSGHSKLDTEFLYCSLRNYVFLHEYQRVVSGSAQPQLPIKDMKRFYCLMPSQEEQQMIIDRVALIDNRIKHEEELLFKLRQQKHGLMHDLLTGRVRVKRI